MRHVPKEFTRVYFGKYQYNGYLIKSIGGYRSWRKGIKRDGWGAYLDDTEILRASNLADLKTEIDNLDHKDN